MAAVTAGYQSAKTRSKTTSKCQWRLSNERKPVSSAGLLQLVERGWFDEELTVADDTIDCSLHAGRSPHHGEEETNDQELTGRRVFTLGDVIVTRSPGRQPSTNPQRREQVNPLNAV